MPITVAKVPEEVESRAQAFVNVREAELGRQYIPIDGDDAQKAWWSIAAGLETGEFKRAVLAELVARGYLMQSDAELLLAKS